MTSLKQFIEILHLCIFYIFRGDQGKITEKSYLITFVGHLDHVVTIGGGVLEEIFKRNGWDLYLFQRFPKLCGYKYYVNKTFLKMQRVERPELSRS